MSSSKSKVVDVHTHMYPPAYVELLESRKTIPLIRRFAGADDPRYVILPAEVEALEKIIASGDDASSSAAHLPGRPVTSHFSSIEQKLHFMDTHGIDISVISLANPWLDFVASADAGETAKTVSQDFSRMCEAAEGRLYFFATLPLTAPPETLLASIGHIRSLRYCRGVILGTTGLGNGLDDPALVPILHALAANRLPIFLHPHYGLPSEVWGPRATEEYGHVLPLALGFPMETTIAVARMYLAGVFDAVPDLRMLLAHSGGTLPFLAGRIESCVAHDAHFDGGSSGTPTRRTIWQVLREQIYLDAVIYSEVGLRAAIDASGGTPDRLLFGTDHPFFPPPRDGDAQGLWESVTWNAAAVKGALGEGSAAAAKVMGGNAVEVLRLYEEDRSGAGEEDGVVEEEEGDSDREGEVETVVATTKGDKKEEESKVEAKKVEEAKEEQKVTEEKPEKEEEEGKKGEEQKVGSKEENKTEEKREGEQGKEGGKEAEKKAE